MLVMLLCSISCVEQMEIPGSESAGPGILLTLPCQEAQTKAIPDTQPGTGSENLIRSVDCWFFNENSSTSVHYGHFDGLNASNMATVAVYVTDAELLSIFPRGKTTASVFILANAPATLSESLVPAMTLEDLKTISFTEDFASVKVPSSFPMVGEGTVTLIKRTSNTPARGTINIKRVASKLSLNVRVSETAVIHHYKQDDDGKYLDADGNILADQTDQSQWVVSSTETWKSMPDPVGGQGGMQVYLANGMRRGKIGCQLYDDPNDDTDFFTYNARSFSVTQEEFEYMAYDPETGTSGLQTGSFYVEDPFYSYPQDLSALYGSPNEPYFKLMVPWAKIDADGNVIDTKQYYYKVMLPVDAIESNNWYRVMLDVAILGSEVDDLSVKVDAGYYVVAWNNTSGTESLVQATIPDASFLTLSQSSLSIYNEPYVEIPFLSSEDCSFSIVSATRYDFISKTNQDLRTAASSWVQVDNINRVVKFNHQLNNNVEDSNVDVSPYRITIRVFHAEAPGTYRDVTITQYPAIYVETTQSDGWVWVYGTSNKANTNVNVSPNYGRSFVWEGDGTDYSGDNYIDRVEGAEYNERYKRYALSSSWSYRTTTDTHFYGYADKFLGTLMNPARINNNYSDEASKDKNRYRVYVSVLDSNSEYVIGDPRSSEDATLSTLTKYNYTGYRETSPDAEKIIAPAFMLSSSYGESNNPGQTWWPMTYEGARKRCASYQEDGYPAGRWRLPTKAEIQYLHKLVQVGKLPKELLPYRYWVAGNWDFQAGQFYDCSHLEFLGSNRGIATYAPDNIAYSKRSWNNVKPQGSWYLDSKNRPAYVTNSEAYTTTRCVYDLWYWGEDQHSEYNNNYLVKPAL